MTVDSGPRARVGDIAIDNNTPYPDRELLRKSKLSTKNVMTAARLSRGSDKLRKFLVNQGYLGASALITPETYDPQSNHVPLKLSAETGPRVRVEVSGARLSKGKQTQAAADFRGRRRG